MNRRISFILVILVTCLFGIRSTHIVEAADIIVTEQHASVRGITSYLQRLELTDNWKNWFDNYLDYFSSENDKEDEKAKSEDEEGTYEDLTEEETQADISEQEAESKKNKQPTTTEPAPKKDKPVKTNPPSEPKQPEKKQEEKKPEKEVSKPPVDIHPFERRVAELTNQERAAHGLAPLIFDTTLSTVAKEKSNDMATNNYFSHQSPTYGSPFEMMTQLGISYFAAAENIAQGQTNPEHVVNSWMNSSGHRANILNEAYTHIGVGYVANNHYWTQMFVGR